VAFSMMTVRVLVALVAIVAPLTPPGALKAAN
jgi:hypothetical protein